MKTLDLLHAIPSKNVVPSFVRIKCGVRVPGDPPAHTRVLFQNLIPFPYRIYLRHRSLLNKHIAANPTGKDYSFEYGRMAV